MSSLRKLTYVTLCVALMLLLQVATTSAQADHPKTGGILSVAVPNLPPTLDWQWSTTDLAQLVGSHIFEGLVTYDEKFNVIPELAEKWETSSDKRVYTIYLRRNVLFHDGSRMTAADVVASIERWRKVSPRASQLAPIQRLEAVDDYTVKVYMNEPYGILMPVLAVPNAKLVILPRKTIQGVPGGELAEFIGTGPYKFVEWKRDQYIKLQRFDRYEPVDSPASGLGGRKVPYVDTILFKPVKEDVSRVAGMETGAYDICEPFPYIEYERFRNNPNVVLEISKPSWMILGFFNHKRAPFNDLKMRQAVLAAIDAREIMDATIGDPRFYRLDPGLMYEEMVWHSTAGADFYNQANPDKARKLLKAAGYDGRPIVLMATRDYPWMYQTGLVFKEQLERVGFRVDFQVYDWATLVDRRRDPDKWHIFIGGLSNHWDPYNWSQNLSTAAGYPGWYSNPKMDALFNELRTETDFKLRYQAFAKIQQLFYEDAAAIKFGDFFNLRAFAKSVKGLSGFTMLTLWNTWLER